MTIMFASEPSAGRGGWGPLGLGPNPVVLAPLAGVSDHPFRRICSRLGADLTYVEMLSATALLFNSPRTLAMAARHPDEGLLGVQITGKSADEVGRAVAVLDGMGYDTIDINMGCPVRKVVSAGCGSAILREPDRVLATVRAARAATSKPLSVKIRLGWDHSSRNFEEVALAAQAGGCDWLTVHGRLRCDDYGVPVDLDAIAKLSQILSIPVWGNGNLLAAGDVATMRRCTSVQGVMISRGAMGNPWLFREIKTGHAEVELAEWRDTVLTHLAWQADAYGPDNAGAAVCMRKHLLWYLKSWPGAKRVRDAVARVPSLQEAATLIKTFADELAAAGIHLRAADQDSETSPSRFRFDPKHDMDRQLDRGVGDEGLQPH